jgi:hypothetical protein
MKKKENNELKYEDKIKTKTIDNFCKHLEDGHSEYSFVDCDFMDIEEYAKYLDTKNNNNIQVEKIKRSLRKSFLHWENIAFEMYKNDSKKHFLPVWIFYMKGRFLFGVVEKNKSNRRNKVIDVNLSLDNDIKEIEK